MEARVLVELVVFPGELMSLLALVNREGYDL
jgi:hypothetical protein